MKIRPCLCKNKLLKASLTFVQIFRSHCDWLPLILAGGMRWHFCASSAYNALITLVTFEVR